MEIFYVFSMNGIENNPASGEIFLENVILKVSQTHFSRISIPRGGINFSRGGAMPPPRGGREVPCLREIQKVGQPASCFVIFIDYSEGNT